MKSPYSTKLVYKIFSAITIVLLALAALPVRPAHAAPISSNGTGGGAWNVGTTWQGGSVPAVGDTVTILGGDTVTMPGTVTQTAAGSVTVNNGATLTGSGGGGANYTFGALTINSGGTVTMQRNLTVLGATNISGTINFGSTSGTQRTMTFTGPVTLNGTAVWNETTTGAAALFTFGNSLTNNAATFTAQNPIHTFSGAGGTISGATATTIPGITFSGSYTNSNVLNATAMTVATGGALINNGTITSPTITVTGTGTLTNNGTVTVATSLAGTGTFTNNSAASVLTISGGSTITTLNAAAAGNKVYYGGGANQTVHANAYSYLYLSGGGVKTIPTGTSVNANLDISGPPPTMSIPATVNIPVTTLSFGGVNQASGTWGFTGSGAAHIDTTHFSNTTGILTVSAEDPTVTTGAATLVSTTGATLNGTVNANNASTIVTFEYGQTVAYGSTATAAQSPVTGTTNTAVSAVIAGLLPNTLYHFRVVGANVGGTVNGLDATFTTAATLTVTGPGSITYGSTGTITTSGGSGTGAMSYATVASTGCTVDPSTGVITVTDASGTCTVNATKAADATYIAQTSADFPVTLNKATAVITFDPAPTPTYLGGNFTVNATTTNTDSAALTYSYVSGPCTFVSGATFSSTGAGTCVVQADGAATTNFNAATQTQNVAIAPADQTPLVVTGPASVTYGLTGTITTSGGSGTGAISYSEGASTGCTVNPSTGVITVTNASGSCTVTATKAADTNYNSATSAPFPVTLNKAAQAALTVTGPASITYGSTGTITTSGGSGTGTMSYATVASTGCTVDPATGVITVTDATGTCTVNATKAADNNYNVAVSADFPVTLNKATPVITFDPAPAPTYLGGDFAVNATTTNTDSAALIYSYVSGPCAFVSGAIFSSTGAGTCVVQADGVATTNFNAATQTQNIIIGKATPVITFDPAPTPTYLGGNFTVNATTTNTDSAALTYSYVSGPCAFVGGATFSSTGAGTCVVQADGAATANFGAASQTQNVIIAPADQTTLAVTGPGSITYGSTDTITTSGGSGTGAMSYSDGASTGCTVNPATGLITVTNASGSCVVTATKAADANYNSATSAPFTVTLIKATAVITFDPAPTPTYLGGNFTVNATTTNTDSAALTYSYVSGPCAFVSGATFSSTGAGTCVVQADGAATANFTAATQTLNVIIAPADQTPLVVTGPASVTYGSTGTITTSGGSGTGAMSYSDGASTGCTVGPVTGVITVTDVLGTCVVTATKAADANYNLTTSAPFTVTLNPLAPTVTTQAVSGIGMTSATGNGNITDLGAPNPTAYGVVWNTTGTPTTADSMNDLGAASATGAFVAPMAGLAPNTLYYVRAFATNTAGTVYGAEVTFITNPLVPVVTTQAVTGIGTTTATGNGDITSLGSPNPTAHGVVWNTTGTPTTADSVSDLGAASATGAFIAPITGLAPNTLYYVRAFATNTAGTSYGAEVTFTTNGIAPTVTTQAVTGIGMTSATGNGNITNLGIPNPAAHGVVWNTTGTPTTADSVNDLGAASATGAFTATMSGLSMNTVYYVRAFATNTAGTSYGAEVSFQTTGTAPTLSPVHIQSNNVNPAFAKSGDTITLTFTASMNITTPTVTIAGHAATVSGGPINWTATYTVVASDPDGLVAFSISNFSDLFGNAGSPVTFTTDASIVTIFTTIPTVSGSTPPDNAVLTTGPTQIFVQFNKDVLHDGSLNAADNLANYLLVEVGANKSFDTLSCSDGAIADDVNIPINSLNYTNNGGTGPFQTTLNINGGVALPVGTYRLFVCGTTSIYDVAGNVLNNRADSRVTILVQLAQQPAALPATGFAPDRVTVLPIQSADKAYAGLGSLWLEIPSLGVKSSIVGVPQTSGNWDVSWLGSQAGWLQGSAFPTWVGNSVLTAHLTNANGKSGPFAGLKNLVYGDRIIVHMQGQQYIYEVRETRTLTANNSSYVFKSLDKYSYLTLLTCQGYNQQTDKYTYRRVVRAVLVSVQADK